MEGMQNCCLYLEVKMTGHAQKAARKNNLGSDHKATWDPKHWLKQKHDVPTEGAASWTAMSSL